jgi:predicted 3-demethylubiquinone-9 3-methyltransferase (glyoxalase superfamily)
MWYLQINSNGFLIENINTQKIIRFFWLANDLEKAINFYVVTFSNSKIVDIKIIGNDGQIVTTTFQLEGQIFMALKGGPMFKFNPAMSLFINYETHWSMLFLDPSLVGLSTNSEIIGT